MCTGYIDDKRATQVRQGGCEAVLLAGAELLLFAQRVFACCRSGSDLAAAQLA